MLRRWLSQPGFLSRAVSVLVLLVALALTLIAAELTRHQERVEQAAVFEHQVEQVATLISSQFSLYASLGRAGQALFVGSTEVTRDDWRVFSEALGIGERYPGLSAYRFVRQIPHDSRDSVVAAIRADGAPEFHIQPPGEREIYCPIVYSEPVSSRAAIGFDICGPGTPLAALMLAHTQRTVVVSGRLTLVDSETGVARVGIVLHAPAADGWVAMPVRVAEMMAAILPADMPMALRMYSGSPGEENLLYAHGAASEGFGQWTRAVDLALPGRTWVLAFSRVPPAGQAADGVLTAGIIISLLLWLLLWRAGAVQTRAVEAGEEKYRTIVESLEDAYFETDLGGNFTFFNDALVRLLGYKPAELKGMNNRAYMHEEDHERVFHAFNRVFMTGEARRGLQWCILTKDGKSHFVEASISLVHSTSGEPTGFRGIARDITERRQADERIHHLAHYDALTGLPNRTLFEDRVRQTLNRRWRSRERAALLYLDLDRFKTVNDSLGHHAGDILLQAVAERIKECVRTGDTVCRPGGDEFLVLLADLAGPEDAASVAEKIITSVSQPYMLESWEFSITPSVGIAVIPDDGNEIETLVRNADAAMYHAKESGRNNFQFFTTEMTEDAAERLSLEHGLRRALERDELVLYYQPLVDVRDGRIVGAEALLRWNRPDHGVVAAGEFIRIVEQSGLILSIGMWVLSEACRQARAWSDRFGFALPVSVNLSALQFRQHGLVETIAGAFGEAGLDPQCLEIELTETVVMQDATLTIETVNRLRELGVHFAIDDFGTGYSSLSYLKRFPIDRVKIDRSFVRDLADKPDDTALINAIIGMARSLRMEVIAEGVETPEQRDYLRQQDCFLMQGYLFSRPVPAAEFERLLEQGALSP
ncbi:MAG: EAL domain-containing protein [Gammaproteobacteria bacterium]